MPALPPVLLLDLDDTLIAFSASVEPCWRAVCAAHAPSGADPDALFAAIRASADAFWASPDLDDRGRTDLTWARRRIVARAFDALGIADPVRADRLADDYTDRREDAIWLFDDVHDVLERVRARGTRLGLLTNGGSVPQRAKIERFDLARFFDLVLIEGELGVGKPDPAVFRAALDHFGAAPEDAWMVGDHLVKDVGGAQSQGIHAVWNDHRGLGLPVDAEVKPDRIVTHVRDLLRPGP